LYRKNVPELTLAEPYLARIYRKAALANTVDEWREKKRAERDTHPTDED